MMVPQAPMPPQCEPIATGQQLQNNATLQKHSRDRRGPPQVPIRILQLQHGYRTTPSRSAKIAAQKRAYGPYRGQMGMLNRMQTHQFNKGGSINNSQCRGK